MQGPKCRFCGLNHFGLCPDVGKKQVKARIAEIESQPVKLGSKGKAKKAKKAKPKVKS